MNAAQRRERILTRLTGASEPMSASLLAGELGVSRPLVSRMLREAKCRGLQTAPYGVDSAFHRE